MASLGSRQAVLTGIRDALTKDRTPRTNTVVRRNYRRHAETDPASILDLFEARCCDYGATVVRTTTSGVDHAIATLLAHDKVDEVVYASDLPSQWQPRSIGCYSEDDKKTDSLHDIDAVLTGCAVAIAETGSIVLDGGAYQGRRALTLVCDLHLCIVCADQVVLLVPEAITRLQLSASRSQPITFISGCSATSDIEMRRVEGVHGPRSLAVILVVPEL
jgi:L-lactate dehydrogenase complex protein LldG